MIDESQKARIRQDAIDIVMRSGLYESTLNELLDAAETVSNFILDEAQGNASAELETY